MNFASGRSSSNNAAQCWVYRVLPSSWLIWRPIAVIWPKKAFRCSLLLGTQFISHPHGELDGCKMLPKVNTGALERNRFPPMREMEVGWVIWKQAGKRWDPTDVLHTGEVFINWSTWYSAGMYGNTNNTVRQGILSVVTAVVDRGVTHKELWAKTSALSNHTVQTNPRYNERQLQKESVRLRQRERE